MDCLFITKQHQTCLINSGHPSEISDDEIGRYGFFDDRDTCNQLSNSDREIVNCFYGGESPSYSVSGSPSKDQYSYDESPKIDVTINLPQGNYIVEAGLFPTQAVQAISGVPTNIGGNCDYELGTENSNTNKFRNGIYVSDGGTGIVQFIFRPNSAYTKNYAFLQVWKVGTNNFKDACIEARAGQAEYVVKDFFVGTFSVSETSPTSGGSTTTGGSGGGGGGDGNSGTGDIGEPFDFSQFMKDYGVWIFVGFFILIVLMVSTKK